MAATATVTDVMDVKMDAGATQTRTGPVALCIPYDDMDDVDDDSSSDDEAGAGSSSSRGSRAPPAVRPPTCYRPLTGARLEIMPEKGRYHRFDIVRDLETGASCQRMRVISEEESRSSGALEVPPATLPPVPPSGLAEAYGVTEEMMERVYQKYVALTDEQIEALLAAEQGSNAWKNGRRRRVGASTVSSFLNLCPHRTHRSALCGMLHDTTADPTPFMCLMGHKNEPVCSAHAQAAFRAASARPIRKITVLHEGTLPLQRLPFVSASIDGFWIVEYEGGLFDVFLSEYKCTKGVDGYGGKVCINYYLQMQQQLFVFEQSGRLDKLMAAHGVSRDRLVPGWKWRCLFAVYCVPKRRLAQLRFVGQDVAVYAAIVARIDEVYRREVLPRIVLVERGLIQQGCSDPMAARVVEFDGLTDLEDETEDGDDSWDVEMGDDVV